MSQQVDRAPQAQSFIGAGGGADYELRLLDAAGRTVGVYRCHHMSDDQARRMVLDARDADYHRYEVWRGMTKIDEGAGFIVR